MGLWEIIKGEQPGIIKSIINYENVGQFGEYITEFALTNNNIKGKFFVLKNIYVPYKDKTTEIDLIMIHEKGIFVFESKNYSGWIFGKEDQINWTQSLENKQKNKFYNPILQNKTHIKALAAYLELEESEFISYIVFSERCELKKVPENTESIVIVKRPNMLKLLRPQLETLNVKYDEEKLNEIREKLEKGTNKTEEEKQQHVDTIKTKCPFCGSELVLRKGKYGAFWGCSTYPKCKYTRPENERRKPKEGSQTESDDNVKVSGQNTK